MSRAPGWTVAKCEMCSGRGVYWNYHTESPAECEDCYHGTVYFSPKGRRAKYPGGPFLGGGALDSEAANAKPLEALNDHS